jgi:D-alanyl-lipoteichoic acid acyltransferase DltB (MBOAT superfamily)
MRQSAAPAAARTLVTSILAAKLDWAIRSDGWLHLVEDGIDLVQGPMGMLLGLLFVPGYWFCPPSRRTLYLVCMSLAVALMTLGHIFTLTFTVLVGLSWWIVRTFAVPGKRWWGTAMLSAMLCGWLVVPQPPWLPHLEPLRFHYLHWAGVAYLYLRTYHVLADVANRRYARPRWDEFVAYLLFLPTMRMGPIQRFTDFQSQLHEDPRRNLHWLPAGGRVLTAGVRLWAMMFLLETFPPEIRLDEPQTLSDGKLIVHLYAAPFPFYLWLSAYTDLSIAYGYVMGFRLPDNFNYPWGALSIDDFWRRWHITLGSWLHGYLFLPMIRLRWHFFWAFVLTFCFCGLWHGTYVSYLLWGFSQGVGMGIRRFWHEYWRRRAQQNSPLYAWLSRHHLVQSRFNRGISWFVNFHFLIVTMNIFLFESHPWSPLLHRVLALFMHVVE